MALASVDLSLSPPCLPLCSLCSVLLTGSLVREENDTGGVEGDDRPPGRGTLGELSSYLLSPIRELLHCPLMRTRHLKPPCPTFHSLPTSRSQRKHRNSLANPDECVRIRRACTPPSRLCHITVPPGKVEVHLGTVVHDVFGTTEGNIPDGGSPLTSVVVRNDAGEKEVPLRGLFYAVGHRPNTGLFGVSVLVREIACVVLMSGVSFFFRRVWLDGCAHCRGCLGLVVFGWCRVWVLARVFCWLSLKEPFSVVFASCFEGRLLFFAIRAPSSLDDSSRRGWRKVSFGWVLARRLGIVLRSASWWL